MKMDIQRVLANKAMCVTLILCGSAIIRSSVIIDLSSSDLTTYPQLLPNNTDQIILNNNSIEEIHYVEVLPHVTWLLMQENLLTAFPNLENISGTIEYLSLASNRINHVNPRYLSILTKLIELYLYSNELTFIPDVLGLSQLKKLSLSGNSMTEFPTLTNMGITIEILELEFPETHNGFTNFSIEGLLDLPQLRDLDLRSNHLSSWVDFCRVPSINYPTNIQLFNSAYNCDGSMILAKLAEATGRITFSHEPPKCATPTELHGQLLNDVKLQNARDQTYFRHLDDASGFYCYPRIVTRLSGLSHIGCGVRCAQREDCAMYAYDGELCALTELAPGSRENFTGYDKWYIRDYNML